MDSKFLYYAPFATRCCQYNVKPLSELNNDNPIWNNECINFLHKLSKTSKPVEIKVSYNFLIHIKNILLNYNDTVRFKISIQQVNLSFKKTFKPRC